MPPDDAGTGGGGVLPSPDKPRVSHGGPKWPGARTPRAAVAINGERLPAEALVSARVVNNGFLAADTFDLTLALDLWPGARRGMAFWTEPERLECEVFVGLGDPARGERPEKSLIVGRVDDVELDLGRAEVQLRGRDFTADLIEAKTSEKFQNETASEVARQLAERHGLTPVVTETEEPVGRLYANEHVRLSDQTSEWALLTRLAELHGFECVVRGRELRFGPPPDPADAPRWTLRWRPPEPERGVEFPQVAAPRLVLRHAKTVATDITVEVISWHAGRKRALRAVARSQRRARQQSGQFGGGARYVFRFPGLTQDQAERLAEEKLRELTRHERVVDALNLPGDPDLDVRAKLRLVGTGTSFDTEYHIEELERLVVQDQGLVMRVRARNLPAEDSGSA